MAFMARSIPAPPPLQGLHQCTLDIDVSTRLLTDHVLIGGTPLRLLRMSPQGREVFDDLSSKFTVATSSEAALARQLTNAGLAHPSWETSPFSLSDVTVVIPVRDRARELDRLLSLLAPLSVIVVDDASSDKGAIADVVVAHGAELLRSDEPLGPGAARNLGARFAHSALVCFIDSDVTITSDDVMTLSKQLTDPHVGAVAPRLRGPAGTSLRDRFEHAASPLDMGPRSALVRPASLVSYVPSATLLVRRELCDELFDPDLHVGEDVDAVLSLSAAGWLVRYDPRVVASHPARSSWRAWWSQRHAYGRSAASLSARHGEAVAPLRGSPWSLLGWLCAALGWPMLGLGLLLGGVPGLSERLEDLVEQPEREALALTLRQSLAGAPLIARQLLRSYAPALLLASLISRRSRRAFVATLVLAGLGRWRTSDTRLDPFRFLMLSSADDLAYCSGLWRGTWDAKQPGALRPRVVRSGRRTPKGTTQGPKGRSGGN